MNELYRDIEKQNLQDKVKIIGLGIGNTPADVEYFKKRYKVPFPLFPDESKSIYQALGKPRAPYFIGVQIKSDGSHQIFYSKLGAFDDPPDQFLAAMIELSGIGRVSQ